MGARLDLRPAGFRAELGWLRVLLAGVGLLALPVLEPALASQRAVLLAYLPVAFVVSRFRLSRRRGVGVLFGVLDFVVLFAFLRVLGCASPMLLVTFFLAVVAVSLARGRAAVVVVGPSTLLLGLALVAEVTGWLTPAEGVRLAVVTPSPIDALSFGLVLAATALGVTLLVGGVVDRLAEERAAQHDLRRRPALGPYRLERLLGCGGMGQVWAATDDRSGRPVALKILPPGRDGEDARARLLREAGALAAIDHPNVVRVLDVVSLPDGSPALVMERLEGESLAARLDRVGSLPLADAVSVMIDVIAATRHAHAAGIVHRDLKPENVFLERDRDGWGIGRARVLDFGVAKLLAVDAAGGHLTETGFTVGTPAYMAPEQAFGGEVDARADVWALGVISYECLTGLRPLRGDGPGAQLRALATDPVTSLSRARPDLPADLCEVVDAMLAKDPTARLHELTDVERVYRRHLGPTRSEVPPLPDRAADADTLTLAQLRPCS